MWKSLQRSGKNNEILIIIQSTYIHLIATTKKTEAATKARLEKFNGKLLWNFFQKKVLLRAKCDMNSAKQSGFKSLHEILIFKIPRLF